jgi:hypothetical protein
MVAGHLAHLAAPQTGITDMADIRRKPKRIGGMSGG